MELDVDICYYVVYISMWIIILNMYDNKFNL